MTSLAPLTLRHGQVRLAWCGRALVDGFRRWGFYMVATVAMLGALASSVDFAIASMRGLAAMLVAPLSQVAGRPVLGAAGIAMLAHSLVGAMVVWALRPMLCPPDWAEAERALPISRSTLLRSDLTVVAISLLPLMLAYLAGALVSRPALPVRSGLLLLGSATLSVMWGAGLLQGMRLPPRGSLASQAWRRRDGGHAPGSLQATLPPWSALVWRPLLDGPARRTGHLMAIGTLALMGHIAALLHWPQQASVVLACFAGVSLSLVSRLNTITVADLKPLHDACRPLPLPPSRLLWARRCLPLLPIAAADALLVPALLCGPLPVRPGMLAAFLVAHVAGCLAQVLPVAPPTARVRLGGWWFTLAVWIALASETLA